MSNQKKKKKKNLILFQVQHTVEIQQQKIKFNAATGFTVRILYDVGKFFSAAYPPPSVLFHAIVWAVICGGAGKRRYALLCVYGSIRFESFPLCKQLRQQEKHPVLHFFFFLPCVLGPNYPENWYA